MGMPSSVGLQPTLVSFLSRSGTAASADKFPKHTPTGPRRSEPNRLGCLVQQSVPFGCHSSSCISGNNPPEVKKN
eukprot:1086148-Rhodomonas_salina.1